LQLAWAGGLFFTIGGGTGSVFGVILAEMTTLSTDTRTIDRTGRIAVLWLFDLLLAYWSILFALF
jgi:hypothetical protein